MKYVPALALALALVAAAAAPAFADAKADCDYLEMSATTGKDAAIDPELKPLEKKLTRKPLSSWNVFRKLSSGHVALAQLKAEVLHLKQGSATLLLRDRADKRLDLTLAMDGSDGKRWLDTKQSVAADDWTVWVHNVKDDGHIVALSCK
jgi:hypothetical protein